jgi:hypothetical protein
MNPNGQVRSRTRRRRRRKNLPLPYSKQPPTVEVASVITPPVRQVDPGLALLQLLKDVSRGICAAIVERLDAAPDFVQGTVNYPALMGMRDAGAEWATHAAHVFVASVNRVCPYLSSDGKRQVLAVIEKDLAPFARLTPDESGRKT